MLSLQNDAYTCSFLFLYFESVHVFACGPEERQLAGMGKM